MDNLIASHPNGVDMLKIEDDPVSLILSHPLVKPQQRLSQPTPKQDIPLVLPLGRKVIPRDMGPPQPLQQQASWFLSMAELV